MNNNYIWYLSYGSNLSRQRFLCYIQGGKPIGSNKEERGCKDHSLPIKDEPYVFSFPLYFARHSKRWDGGVAYVDIEKDVNSKTLGRMYLITKEQFTDVVAQETNNEKVNINFEEVIKDGSKQVTTGTYGNILYLGTKDEYPIFTFTSNDKMENVPLNRPTKPYVDMIIRGLVETFDFSEEEAYKYLSTIPGFSTPQ